MSEQMPTRDELEAAYMGLMGGNVVPPTFIGRRASEIPVRPVSWLWTGRIPLGTLTVLDGDPGLGKSTLTAAITAAVTKGEPLPGDTGIPRGAVVFISIEDDPGAVIIPRLQAAGADIDQVIIPEPREGVIERTVMLPEDLANVQELVEASAAKLVIVDPLMATLSAQVSSDRDQDVRRVLAELNRIAGKTEAAVLIVRHLNKSTAKQAIYRGGGSIGIIGAARSGLLMTRHPQEPTGLLLTVSKSNLGVKPPGLGLRVETGWNGVGVIAWGSELEISADDALAGPSAEQEEAATERSQAEAWLREALQDGSIPAKQVFQEAEDNGFTMITIKRAKANIGVRSAKVSTGTTAHWRWFLGDRPEPAEGDHAYQEDHGRGMGETDDPLAPDDPLSLDQALGDGADGVLSGDAYNKERTNDLRVEPPGEPVAAPPRDSAEQGDQEDQGDHAPEHPAGDPLAETSAQESGNEQQPEARTRLSSLQPLQPIIYDVAHDGCTAEAIRADWVGREEELYRLYPRHVPLSSFNPLAIDRETWGGPWCQRCQMEPVEHEGAYCPNCLTLARKLAHWSS